MPKSLKELRAELEKVTHDARAEYDKIKPDTPESDARGYEAAFDGLMSQANELRAQITRAEKLAELESLQNAGDPRAPIGDQPEGRAAGGGEPMEYRQAFYEWLTVGGNVQQMSGEARQTMQLNRTEFTDEQRALIVANNAAGGFLVPDEPMKQIIQVMKTWGPMWDDDFCTVLKTEGGGEIPLPGVDDTDKDAVKTAAEAQGLTDDGSADPAFFRNTLNDFMVDTKWVRLSLKLATSGMPGVEMLLAQLLGKRLGKKANRDLTIGSGSGEALGVVTGAALGKTTAGAAITADEIIEFSKCVDAAYRGAPKFRTMMNDNTLTAIQKLKDANDQYLVTEAPDGSGKLRIGSVTLPYAINNAMSDIGSGNRSMVIGDFGLYYVRKIGGIVVATNHMDKDFWPDMGLAGYARFDGVIADPTAIKAMVHP